MTAAVLAPSRRSFLAGGASLAALSLAGCATQRMKVAETPQFDQYYLSMLSTWSLSKDWVENAL